MYWTILRVVALVGFGFATSGFLSLVFLHGPILAYFYFSPSDMTRCSSIRPGLTGGEALGTIPAPGKAYFESAGASQQLIFHYPHYSCTIDLDANGVVVRAQAKRSSYYEFVTEAVEAF
jgi:hypothetical protein